jgi:hypothetical protein
MKIDTYLVCEALPATTFGTIYMLPKYMNQ